MNTINKSDFLNLNEEQQNDLKKKFKIMTDKYHLIDGYSLRYSMHKARFDVGFSKNLTEFLGKIIYEITLRS